MKVAVRGKYPNEVDEAITTLKKYNLEISEDPDILITLGGDGTTLHWYRIFKKPILPIRSNNPKSQGYISDIEMTYFWSACDMLAKGLFSIEKRLMLDVYRNEEKICSVINDVTIKEVNDEKSNNQALRFGLYADNRPLFKYEKLIGDGANISTPTGSSAYTASAGGFVLDPEMDNIEVTLMYHLPVLKDKSKIIKGNSILEFKLYEPDRAFLAADVRCLIIKNSDRIIVKKSSETFDFVKIQGMEETRDLKEKRRLEWYKKQKF